MKEYEVFLRGVVPNCKIVVASSPLEARRMVEAEGFRVRAVKPVHL